jgi:Mrp family chromosome partitioning ATPase
VSVIELESPAAATPSGDLLDLRAALEQMEQLSTVAEAAGRAPAPRARLLPGEVTEEGAVRLIRLTDEIQAVVEHEHSGPAAAAELETPLAGVCLPVECRAVFEILNPNCPRPWAEAFRKLRGRLAEEKARWEAAGRRLHSIAILSPRRGGGRSLTARNLAGCLGAQPDARVLLVDADARRPELHKRLRMPESPGLAEAISAAGEDWVQFVRRVPESGLYVLPCGAPRGGIDALDYARLPEFLDRAAQNFTWVVMDAAPMETADGEAISCIADASLLVLRNQREYFDEAGAAVRRLDPSRLVGSILNFAS